MLADFTHIRACKPFCEKYLTLPLIGPVHDTADAVDVGIALFYQRRCCAAGALAAAAIYEDFRVFIGQDLGDGIGLRFDLLYRQEPVKKSL